MEGLQHAETVTRAAQQGVASQVKLLLWRNWLLKKRHWATTVSEFVLPLLYVLLVVWLQTKDPDVHEASGVYTCPRQSSLSPSLLFPEEHPEEHREFVLELSTTGFGPGVLTVPPLAYLVMVASKLRYALAFAPGPNAQAAEVAWLERFRDELDLQTAAFDGPAWQAASAATDKVLGFGFCRFGKMVKMFESQAALDAYVTSADYGTSTWPAGSPCADASALERPKLHMALVLDKAGDVDGVWEYTIQTNVSVIPYTYPDLGFTNKIEPGVNILYADQYAMSGFLTLQQAVDRAIINRTVSDAAYVRRVALRQVCDTVEPLLPYAQQLAPDAPALHDVNCSALLGRLAASGEIDLSPLYLPAARVPNDVRLTEFPTPEYTDRPFYKKIKDVFGLDLILTFLWPVSRLIRGVVHEKETKQREGMRMMGMHYSALYLSWFVTYGLLFLLVAAAATGLTHGAVFARSAPSVVFLYLFLFGLSATTYCFAVSVLFNRAKTAATAGVVLFFMGFFPFFAVSSQNATAAAKHWALVLSPTAFGLGATTLATYEGSGAGVTWDNIWDTPNDAQIPFAHILLALVADTLLYAALTFYLDNVVPQEFGVRRVWYFPLQRSYWTGHEEEDYFEQLGTGDGDGDGGGDGGGDGDGVGGTSAAFVEEPSAECKLLEEQHRCVKMTGLRKVFGSGAARKVAVEGLSVTMVEGEIFALLGHNGAGKSTTISVATGLLPASGGDCTIFGHSVAHGGMGAIRQQLGVCPQHDVLFPELTVAEHLFFFAALKNVPAAEADAAVRHSLAEIALEDKRDVQAGRLSGGQKRKLSVAIALLGDSKVVFLDEPTSGMDAYSRRSTWNMLQRNRRGRVIVLTTHFMDEADLLGDKIAIMAEGRLQCCGSSLFLKARYGVGYTLTFGLQADVGARDVGARAEAGPTDVGADAGVGAREGATDVVHKARVDRAKAALTELVTSALPTAEVFSSVGSELAVKLALSEAPNLPALFDAVDARSDKDLLVDNYGISVTTLEEVFLKVASDAYGGGGATAAAGPPMATTEGTRTGAGDYARVRNDDDDDDDDVDNDGHQGEGSEDVSDSMAVAEEGDLAGRDLRWPQLFSRHVYALYAKRFHYAKRDRRSMCCNTFLPILLLVMGLGLLKAFPLKTPPALELSLEQFKQPVNFVPVNATGGGPGRGDETGIDEAQLAGFLAGLGAGSSGATSALPAAIERGLNNSCALEPLDDIPHGGDLRGLSEWLLRHQRDNATSLYGAVQVHALGAGGAGGAGGVEVTILCNSTAKHGPGVYMALVDQALLRMYRDSAGEGEGEGKGEEGGGGGEGGEGVSGNATRTPRIRTTNHPFAFTSSFKDLLDSFAAVSASISVVIAFSFVPASVAIFVVNEREIAAKHQQLISGASILAYWVSAFLWDMCMYLVPWFFSVVAVRLFGISAFEGDNFPAVVLLFLLYGFATLPFTYLVSFLFSSHSTAQNVVLLLNFMTGLVLIIASFVMSVIESTMHVNHELKYLYRLFPGFCLGNGLLGLTVDHSKKQFLPEEMADASPFAWNVVGAELVYLAGSGALYFALTLAVDYTLSFPWLRAKLWRPVDAALRASSCAWGWVRGWGCLAASFCGGRSNGAYGGNGSNGANGALLREALMHESGGFPAASPSGLEGRDPEGVEDEDVARERLRVDTGGADGAGDVIVLRHLGKTYGDGKEAVRGLTFGVARGECLGLLGTNGAGKTTTTKMITGDVLPSKGTAQLAGKDILTQQNALRRKIGYCPQFDALLEHLTVKEHLELFARIKCVPAARVAAAARAKMLELNLGAFENKTAGTLSGGNRRKLSVAIAMVGAPPLLFLDEPTSGMDVYNKRFLLDVISRIPARGGTVVLTSHSMEECEALCTKVGIMVAGQFQCFGSVQHLKSRFGKGLMAVVKSDVSVAGAGAGAGAVEAEPGTRADVEAGAGAGADAGAVQALSAKQREEAAFARLRQFFQDEFPGAKCVERRGVTSRWQMPESDSQGAEKKLALGRVFAAFEASKASAQILEYAVSGVSLEQVFVMFAAKGDAGSRAASVLHSPSPGADVME